MKERSDVSVHELVVLVRGLGFRLDSISGPPQALVARFVGASRAYCGYGETEGEAVRIAAIEVLKDHGGRTYGA